MRKSTILGALAAALAAASPAAAHDFKSGSIEIQHPWSRVTPKGAEVAAGYLVIDNEGDAADRLVSVTADVAGRTEIHQMTMKDGLMTMRAMPDGVEVPAKGQVAFAPSGYHLMFKGLKEPLKLGEKFPGVLTFEKAGAINVEFVVEPIGATKPDHGAAAPSGMDHGSMDHGSMDHGGAK